MNSQHTQNAIDHPSSWIIRNKITKVAVTEIFNRSVVDKVNTEKYEAIPILLYLCELNRGKK